MPPGDDERRASSASTRSSSSGAAVSPSSACSSRCRSRSRSDTGTADQRRKDLKILPDEVSLSTVFVLDASAPRTLSVRSYERLESGIAAALGSEDFALAAAEYFDDKQLAKMNDL
jgi:hypothetical protein